MNEKKVIMIIDDDPDDRFFFLDAVKKIDQVIECVEADGSLQALELLRNAEQLPDFIFLDLNMPLMDGGQCLTALKKDAKLKNIPVIIYSTSDSQKDKDAFIVRGAAHYLYKPSNIAQFPGEIANAINMVEQSK